MKLWDFYLDYGRHGELSGTFWADEEDIENAIGKTVSWYEELGKHSQDDFVLTREMITPHTASVRGFNPLDNIEETE